LRLDDARGHRDRHGAKIQRDRIFFTHSKLRARLHRKLPVTRHEIYKRLLYHNFLSFLNMQNELKSNFEPRKEYFSN
jgi:hypothetical protein